MLARCQFTSLFHPSKRCLPTWEEAESCHGNMMPLSVSFSFYCPLRMSHPYLLMSGSLAWGLISANGSYTTWGTCQGQRLPARELCCHADREENQMKGVDPIQKTSAVSDWVLTACSQLVSAEIRRFSKEMWSLWGYLHRKLKKTFPLTFSVKITMKIWNKNASALFLVREHKSAGGPHAPQKGQLNKFCKTNFPFFSCFYLSTRQELKPEGTAGKKVFLVNGISIQEYILVQSILLITQRWLSRV